MPVIRVLLSLAGIFLYDDDDDNDDNDDNDYDNDVDDDNDNDVDDDNDNDVDDDDDNKKIPRWMPASQVLLSLAATQRVTRPGES